MKSWGLIIFVGFLSVVAGNIEYYTYYKQGNKKSQPQATGEAAVWIPLGIQLPTTSQSNSGVKVAVFPQQGIPRELLRANPELGSNGHTAKVEETHSSENRTSSVRSDNKTHTTPSDEPKLECHFPEYEAVVCANDLETTCDRPYVADPKCVWKQERCLCTEGYVRPHDYHTIFNVKGQCLPESSCKKKN